MTAFMKNKAGIWLSTSEGLCNMFYLWKALKTWRLSMSVFYDYHYRVWNWDLQLKIHIMLILTCECSQQKHSLILTSPPPPFFFSFFPSDVCQAKSICYLYLNCGKHMWKLTCKINCYSCVSKFIFLKTCFSDHCKWFTKSWHIQQEFVPLQVATARKPVFNMNS